MFDDIPTQGGSVPPNLPTGEPEDIFASVPDDVSDDARTMPPAAAPVEDTPVTKTALSAGMLQPKSGEAAPMQPSPRIETPVIPPSPETPTMSEPSPSAPSAMHTSTPPVQTASPAQPAAAGGMKTHTMPGDAPELYSLKEPKASKGIITIIVVIVVVTVLGGGGLFIYNQFIAGTSNDTNLPPVNTDNIADTNAFDTIEPIDNVDTVSDDTVDTVQPTTETTTINRPDNTNDVLFGEPTDTDADGLDDAREDGLGTDPEHWDTDGDELSDGDEVIIWKTDPLNPDTDGDTFLDGVEIKNGYSPTGPGKIFEPPTESATSTS